MRGVFLLLLPITAGANGQSTHVWITLHALEHLPDGELRELLTDPDVRTPLLNGAMYPDGGYAVNDGYGELGHWEPWQDRYLDWIRTEHPAPFDDEGREHVAFLMGMGSHGMVDQTFDAMFMERSKHYDVDGWQEGNFDTATDVLYVSELGKIDVPDKWVPLDLFAQLYADHGHEVDASTIDDGQSLLGVAIAAVGAAGANAELVAEYEAMFPWAAEHLGDPDMPGSPPCEGELVSLYWQVLWERLHGGLAWDDPIIGIKPGPGQYVHTRDASSVDAMVSVVLSRGVDQDTVTEDTVRVETVDGSPHPVDVWVFYRDASHVVNLVPRQDWAEDTDYVVRVLPGITSFDGVELATEATAAFTTRVPVADDEAEGCGCRAAPVSAWWLALPVLALGRRRC